MTEKSNVTWATFGPTGGLVPDYGAVPPTTYSAEVDLTTCKVTAADPRSLTVSIPVSDGTSLTSPWTTSAGINTAKVRITESDIELDGLSLRETLTKLNERMAIMVPNPELEKDFEQLRNLRTQYEALERELSEKAKTWATLKNTDK